MVQELKTPDPYQSEHATIFVDAEVRLAIFTFYGTSSPQVVGQVYSWTFEALATPDISLTDLRGSIYDFRKVEKFDTTGLMTVKKQSQTLNVSIDLSKHPVALIVKDDYQKRMVQLSKMVTPGEHRKAIVEKEEDALAFIKEWNKKHDQTFGLSDELMMKWPETPPALRRE